MASFNNQPENVSAAAEKLCLFFACGFAGNLFPRKAAKTHNERTKKIAAILARPTVSLGYGGEGPGCDMGEEKAVETLNEAGFPNVSLHHLDHDLTNTYYVLNKA